MNAEIRRSFIAIGGVALIKGRIRPPAGPTMVAVATELCDRLWDCDWLEPAPFDLVNLILRFGESKPETEIRAVNKRHSELPVARELSMVDCVNFARNGELYNYFMSETVTALTDISDKYNLSHEWRETTGG